MENPRLKRLQELQQMLSAEPDDDFLNHALAMEYLSAGEIQNAVSTFEKLLSRNPDYLASYYQLGRAYEKINANDKAIRIYKAGIELAKKQNNKKALGELNEALWMLED